jgi:tetratricopeptide (TPR) repeat protein
MKNVVAAAAVCALALFLQVPHFSFASGEKGGKSEKAGGEGDAKGQKGGKGSGAADDTKLKKAISHFEKGVGFFDEGNYSAALAEFLKSYELVPNWALLYNIGVCYSETGRTVEAYEHLKKYLEQGKDEIPAERRSEVEETVSKLKSKIGYLWVESSEPGAAVKVDKFRDFTTPLKEPIAVVSGFHTISVKKAGFEGYEEEFSIASGETKVMKVALAALKKTPSAVTGEGGKKPVEPKKKKPLRWLWAGLGAGLALGAGAAVTGGMALKKRNDMLDVADACDATVPRDACAEAYDLQDQAKSLQIATDVLWGSAVGLAIVGIILFSVDKPRPQEKKKEKEKEKSPGGKGVAAVTIAPMGSFADPGSFGVQALISFY